MQTHHSYFKDPAKLSSQTLFSQGFTETMLSEEKKPNTVANNFYRHTPSSSSHDVVAVQNNIKNHQTFELKLSS